ncbi:MAG: PorV/PorQ family protein [bacterium]|nr:PorV/PorQ family protein [bacterium]MBK7671789.1 PorV/PorQ family protein [bacterium]
MKRILLTVAMAAALTTGFCGAALAGSGAGAINLSFPVGARYNALGEAGTALSQDVTAQWWNPGGLGFLPQRPEPHDVHIMQSSLAEGLAEDIGLYWGGYATPMGDNGAIGFSLNYLDMGEQQGTDESGNETGVFRSYMFAFGATYGVRVTPNVGVGLGVKYFRDKLAEDNIIQDAQGGGSGDSFGVDLGVLWKVPSLKSNFGLALANLGPDIKHVDADQSDPMPRKLTVGIAHSLYHSEYMGMLLVADYLVPLYKWKGNDYGFGLESSQEEYGFGAEWNYLRSLFVRIGYKSAAYGDIKDTTFGFGVDLDRWVSQPITFDFAKVPQAEGLPTVTRLSLAYRF